MKAFSESLDQGSLATFQKWFDLINKATRWDTSIRTVRKQRREHTTIMSTWWYAAAANAAAANAAAAAAANARNAAAAKVKRELDLAMPAAPPPPPPVMTHPPRSEARLAPLVIPEFDGDKTEFHSYWNQFETMVDKNQSLDAVTKFMNLKKSLRGEAHLNIQHLMITDDDYETAKDILKRLYGNEESVIKAIRRKLMAMREWSSQSEVKRQFTLAESYINQLTKLTGTEYNSPEALDFLTKCLTKEYRVRLRTHKAMAFGAWDLRHFRKAMLTIIQEDDEMDEDDQDSGQKVKQSNKFPNSRNSDFKNNRASKDQSQHTMSFAAVQSRKGFPGNSGNNNRPMSSRGSQMPSWMSQDQGLAPGQSSDDKRRMNPCIFCGEEGHLHWLCPMEGRSRTNAIMRSGRCTQCLEMGHFNRDCHAECCRKCGGRHHSWLHYNNAK